MLTAVLFVVGLALLVVGAEWLVKGASKLATAAGISPLVIGLTVVAFGTSAPELAVSVNAAWSGQADIAVGNVLGSNICNVLLILGLSALITPLVVTQQLVRLDVPLMIGASILLYGLALNGQLAPWEGLLLFLGSLAYTLFAIVKSRRDNSKTASASKSKVTSSHHRGKQLAYNLGLIVLGLGMLVVGAHWLVDGAVAAAQSLGVSELVIGLTVIAVGTSLPEIATSVIASLRGERDIAVGNVVGSNLFNILLVLGLTALVAPTGVAVAPAVLRFDMLVMIAASVACLPIFFTGHRIDRWEGGLFFGYYVLYLVYLSLEATSHSAFVPFTTALLGFMLPLTAITLLVSVWRAWQKPPLHE